MYNFNSELDKLFYIEKEKEMQTKDDNQFLEV